MERIELEMTARQYAGLREGLAYLAKQLRIGPRLRDDCVLASAELDGLLVMMAEQVSEIELVRMLAGAGTTREGMA